MGHVQKHHHMISIYLCYSALHLAWVDYGGRERPGATQDLYAKVWTGTQFIEELPGDAQERGVTVRLSQVTAPA